MKRILPALCGGVLLAALAAPIRAQEPGIGEFLHRDTLRGRTDRTEWGEWGGPEFRLPDSLAHLAPWQPDYRTLSPLRSNPAVSMTSVLLLEKEQLPRRIVVFYDNAVRLGHHVVISNGQAWTNGSYPDAFLDARTLSFPMPR